MEDDGQDDLKADEVWGGSNGRLSLTEARNQYAEYIAAQQTPDPASVAAGGAGLWWTAAMRHLRDLGQTLD